MQFLFKKPLFALGLLAILLALPLTVLVLQKNSDTRSRAATVCSKVPSDVSVIIDKSGSMNDQTTTGTGPTKIAGAKVAASQFVDILAQDAQNRADLVTFSTTANLDVPLTTNLASVKTAINAISAIGYTCTECGIQKANADIQSGGRSGIKKVVVLLTDGISNYIVGSSQMTDPTVAEQKALAAAVAGHTASGTIFFTIGLGNDVNTAFLQQIAIQTGGKYYFPPSTASLNAIYAEISQIIAQGSVNGMVFNDLNHNTALDQSEPKLPGWTVQAISSSSITSTVNAATDASGNYLISGLCDGAYTLKPVLQSGWTPTLPTNQQPHIITIVNGNAITGKDFGVMLVPPTPVPTATPTPKPTATPTPTPKPTSTPIPTPTPGVTRLSIELLLHGIGSSGDNTNQATHALSNKNPLHPVQEATVTLVNASNVLVGTASGNVTYASSSGSYKGIVEFASGVTTGSHNVKLKAPRHLTKLVPGIQSIIVGGTNSVLAVHLIAGDVNNDNKINILDYNLLIDCYADLSAAPACNPQKKVDADLNDDGDVNQFDYNLFVRELSTQLGN